MCKHHSWGKALIFSVNVVLLLCLLSSSLLFSTHIRTASATDSVFYDFITQAPSASWSSGAGSLPFPGSDNDSRGFALYRDNFQLEDNSTWERALETHPEWVSAGWIMGVYPEMTVPSDAELKVTVGFLKGAAGSDGVTFEVKFEELFLVGTKTYSILSHRATYDGKLDSITAELSSLEGKTGNFILYVNAVKGSGQDWAAWAEAKIEMAAPPALPDLIIEEIICDREDSQIGYVIKNIGEAAASPGHATVLFVDGKAVCEDIVDLELAAGESHESWFDAYAWPKCQTIEVAVCADNHAVVEESNEQNNCLEEVCECIADIAPPQIISGPTVSQLTPASAVICWDTDEASDSVVSFDYRSGMYASISQDSKLVTEHCLSLTKLEPATTYHFMVESTDSSGNQVRSRDLDFETLSSPDDENPSLRLILPDTLSGRVTISVDAQDNIGVDRVVFFIDGKPMHTDYSYSSPFEWEWDTMEYPSGLHEFSVQAFDFADNVAEVAEEGVIQNLSPDPSAPIVTILNPRAGDVFGATIPIEVQVQDNGGISAIKFYIDGDEKDGWTYTKTYYEDPITGETIPSRPPTRKRITYSWVTAGLDSGSEHTIEVKAFDCIDPPHIGSDSLRVTFRRLEPPDPELILELGPNIELRRDVERKDNYFEVTLEVENTGGKTVSSILINDINNGFQCLQGADPCEVTYNPMGQWSTVVMRYPEDLEPGKTISLQYYAIPILFDPYSKSDYVIGHGQTYLSCTADDKYLSFSYSLPRTPEVPEDKLDVEAALRSADYLIVTNPYNLFGTNSNHDDVNRLLCTMADLAKEKLGVLGYLYAPASLRTSLEGNDALALGDVNNDGRDEIVIGRVGGDEEGRIDIYDLGGRSGNLWTNLTRSQGLAVGDVWGDDAEDIVTVYAGHPSADVDYSYAYQVLISSMAGDWLSLISVEADHNFCGDDVILLGDVVGDSKKEVILGVEREGVIVCYYDSAERTWLNRSTVFEDGDAVAVGDVWGDEKEDIIIANQRDNSVWGLVVVFDGDELRLGGVAPILSTCYGYGDALALGDITGDSKEEVIVGDRDSRLLEVYQYQYDTYGSSLLFSVDSTLTGGPLTVGDVWGLRPGKEEIIIADDETGVVDIYGYSDYRDDISLKKSFGTAFDEDDHFIIGDVMGIGLLGYYEEIVIGNRGGSEDGYIEVICVEEGFPRDRERLQELIKEGGDWNRMLCADWSDEGYLLLVGETEIIPACTAHWWRRDINCTDYPYASTAGDDEFPELCIGRIIGNTAAELIIPIQNSLDVWRGLADFYRDNHPLADAYGLAGGGEGADLTRDSIIYIFECIGNEFDYLFSAADGVSDLVAAFLIFTMDRDVIVYQGHGSGTLWDWGGGTQLEVGGGGFGYLDDGGTWQNIPVNFGSTRPLIFALSCSAGRYAGITGIAESLLRMGGVYIGATEGAPYTPCKESCYKFFENWIGHRDKTIGQAWEETRLWAMDETEGENHRYWGAEFQLYGDPKFGAER